MGLKQKATEFHQQSSDTGLEEIDTENRDFPRVSSPDRSFDKKSFLHSDDLHSSSRPVVHGLAQQNQIEALFNLLELSKEMHSCQNDEDLWSVIIFTLMGQLGIREVAIFLKREGYFVLVANKGFIIKNDFKISFDGSLLKSLSEGTGIIYMNRILSKLKSIEKIWFNSLNADLVIPISNYEDTVGFIILGKPAGSLDYNLEDLMYLKILGELLGSYYEAILQLLEISEKNILWKEREASYSGIKRYLELMERATEFEQIDEAFWEIIQYNYEVKKFIFLLRDGKNFLPNLHQDLDSTTIQKFKISQYESWVIEMKNYSGWYEYKDFREDSKFTKKFSTADLALLDHVFVFPVYFADKVDAIFLLFDIEKRMTIENLRYLDIIINSYYWAFIAYKTKASKIKNIEDPLIDLRSLLHDQELELQAKETPYSVLYISIENSGRLIGLKGESFFENQKSYLKNFLISTISEKDNCMEIFPAKFLMIVRGKTKKDCKYTLERLKEVIALKYKSEELRPLLRAKILSRPEEQNISLDSFLFD